MAVMGGRADSTELLRSFSVDLITAIIPDLTRVADELYAKRLLPGATRDDTITGIPNYEKASRLMAVIQRQLAASSDQDYYLMRVCGVLQKQDNPKLKKIAENMLQQLVQSSPGHDLLSLSGTYGSSTSNLRSIKNIVYDVSENGLIENGSRSRIYNGYHKNQTGVWRRVAVKEIFCLNNYSSILDDVKRLLESDYHENIVEYVDHEYDSDRNYVYIAMELCLTSLKEYVDGNGRDKLKGLFVDSKIILQDSLKGLKHLHSLNIIHRDIKPGNILLTQRSVNEVKAVLCDFAISSQIEEGHSSVTIVYGRGTFGWKAPELYLCWSGNSDKKKTCTKAVDIFAMGCVIYYVLSSGGHPFGKTEIRALSNIESEGEDEESEEYHRHYPLTELPERVLDRKTAEHLIKQMIAKNIHRRPTASEVLSHCYFWSKERQLEFLQDVSDWLDSKDPSTVPAKTDIESDAKDVIGNGPDGWKEKIHPLLAQDLHKYNSLSLEHLLRAIRNKKHHGLTPATIYKAVVGASTDQFLTYFMSCFPSLLIYTYIKVEPYAYKQEEYLRRYYFAHNKFSSYYHKLIRVSDVPDESQINEWLDRSKVDLTITRINMYGPPRAGKTCTQHLLKNDPPTSSTDSTEIARSAIKASRMSSDDGEIWKVMTEDDMLQQLASNLKESSDKDAIPIAKEQQANESEVERKRGVIQQEKNFEEQINDEGNKTEENNEATHNDSSTPVPIETNETTVPQPPTPQPSTHQPIISDMLYCLTTNKVKTLSTQLAYIIDSGGQPAYQELLPLFVRTASVNVITIDLSIPFEEKFTCKHWINGKTYSLNQEISNKDVVECGLLSRTEWKPIEIPNIEIKSPAHPISIVLGTHYDKLARSVLSLNDDTDLTEDHYKSDEVQKAIREIHNKLEPFKDSLVRYQPDPPAKESLVYPVNTMIKESEGRKEVGRKLWTFLTDREGAFLKINMPVRWFAFEMYLQKLGKDKNSCFLTKEEVFSAGNKFKMSKSKTEEALKFLHNVTIILYFHNIPPVSNLVFVNPQPILNILSQIIALTYISPNVIASPAPSHEDINKLKTEGRFKKAWLHNLKSKPFSSDFEPSHFIDLLEGLHIIAALDNKGSYFLPCALRSRRGTLNPLKTDSKPLLLLWQDNNDHILPVPHGVFTLTIVHLLQHKDFQIKFVNSPKYQDDLLFEITIEHPTSHLHVIKERKQIAVYFDGPKEHCPQVYKLIKQVIKKSSDEIGLRFDSFKTGFPCKDCSSPAILYIPNEDTTRAYMKCSPCVKIFPNLSDDVTYHCWIKDQKEEDQLREERGHKMQQSDDSLNLAIPNRGSQRDKKSPSELFRRHSADIIEDISLNLSRVITNLNAQSLIPQSFVNLISQIGVFDYDKAVKVVDYIQCTIKTSPDPNQYLIQVCHVLLKQDILTHVITDILTQLGQPVNTDPLTNDEQNICFDELREKRGGYQRSYNKEDRIELATKEEDRRQTKSSGESTLANLREAPTEQSLLTESDVMETVSVSNPSETFQANISILSEAMGSSTNFIRVIDEFFSKRLLALSLVEDVTSSYDYTLYEKGSKVVRALYKHIQTSPNPRHDLSTICDVLIGQEDKKLRDIGYSMRVY